MNEKRKQGIARLTAALEELGEKEFERRLIALERLVNQLSTEEKVDLAEIERKIDAIRDAEAS